MNSRKIFFIVLSLCLLVVSRLFAQDKQAELKLDFTKEDSVNVCNVNVVSEGKPAAEVTVKLFVKRLFGLLSLGEIATDESGVARFEVPADIPGDAKGVYKIIAKIEDDENIENTEAQNDINWGVIRSKSLKKDHERSLSASRGQAPVYFIIISNLIIILIWGTIIYCILQVFKIKRISSVRKQKIST